MRTSKLSLIAALALGGFLAGNTTGWAQSTNAPAHKPRRDAVHQRVDRMATELKLTDDQKSKVTSLFEAEAKKQREIASDTSVPKEQRRSKMTALRDEQNKKLKEILTPDQFEKWEKMRQQFRPRRADGGGTEKKAE